MARGRGRRGKDAHFFFFGAGMIDSDEAFVVEAAAEPGSFFFFGFLTSLFPRIWPLAMVVSIPASITLDAELGGPGNPEPPTCN
jgi:hypothetical protein